MDQTYMKDRPVLPLLLSMSLPMMFSMLVNSLYNIVDSFFVAKISEDAMTALSLVFPIQNLINAVTIGFSIGINAVISYHLGAQEQEKANTAAVEGLLLNALNGLLLMAASIAFIPSFLRMFTEAEAVIAAGVSYSRTAFLFSTVIALAMAIEKIFQAEGKMRESMCCMLAGCLTNILLDPLLIFGWGPIPALGMQGAALATGIGQTVNFLSYAVLYRLGALRIRLRFRGFRFQRDLALRLYAVGIPSTLNLALPSLLISSLNSILALYSQSRVLVLGIYYKLQTFLYLPTNGLVQGMRPLIGYNYGAGELRRVREIYRSALALTAAIMALGTLLCQAVPAALAGLFTENPETIALGAAALRVISLGFLVSAVPVISCGALEGLGKGGPSLLISLLRYVLCTIPLAYLFSRAWGPDGVWYAFPAAETLTAVLAFLIFRRQTEAPAAAQEKEPL